MNKKLVIFSDNLEDRKNVLSLIPDLIGNHLDFISMDIDDPLPLEDIPAVLAVETTYEKAKKLFPNSKILIVSRHISNKNLEELIMIPKNTSVIVANELQKVTYETIQGLKDLGISHLNFVPYWPGKKDYDPTIDIVIYPGFKEYTPPGHKRYIDIGYRDIKFSVISEILKVYNLPSEILDEIQKNYSKRYVSTAYTINSHLSIAETSMRNFREIFSISENILISTNSKHKIININKSAEKFFNISTNDVIGKDFFDVFKLHPALIQIYANNSKIENHVTVVNNTSLVIKIDAFEQNKSINKLVSLVPADAIQKTDEKIRTKLKESGFKAKYTFDTILGKSNITKNTIMLAKQYAKCNSTVLIEGESGTGKELFAQAMHNASSRQAFPFVGINCAALPESLAESELLGYEEGSFTGASKGGKAGKFELAHKGTIFLDEIGDMPLNMQTKLLRIIEEQEIVRIGSGKVIPIDVRIICATNKDLRGMVDSGTFREDLFYRINVLPLKIPALRYRKEDIPEIANVMFLKQGIYNEPLKVFLTEKLCEYDWPGNIRELRSAIQYLATLISLSNSSDSEIIDKTYWSEMFQRYFSPVKQPLMQSKNISITKGTQQSDENISLQILSVIEKKSADIISFGKGALLKDPAISPLGLTEYRLKKYISKFVEMGLITVGSTKQGIKITEKGCSYLHEYI